MIHGFPSVRLFPQRLDALSRTADLGREVLRPSGPNA
jgi:hypothetical protein